jgi:uncharacterized protein
MRIVLDTNVIISSFLVSLGSPARIIAGWRAGLFDLVVSPVLLAEYEEVLGYDRIVRRHGMTPEQIGAEVAAIHRFALEVEPQSVPAVIQADPDDDHVLACAVAGRANYIISGDPHLLDVRTYEGIRILSPAAFAALLAEET